MATQAQSFRKPSETARGKAWIENFAMEDRPTAQILIDALRIASETEVRAGTLALLDGVLPELPKPALVLPVRSLDDFGDAREHKPMVYRDFTPYGDYNAEPGSEVLAASLIREIIRDNGLHQGILPPASNLEDLRSNKCRSLVLVDDYSGSGSQVISYVKSWLRHPSIRSWRSYGLLQVYVILYAASPLAIKALGRSGLIKDVYIYEMAASFAEAQWEKGELERVTKLCIQYASKRRKRDALGYKGSAGLFLIQHTVPNNLPAVMLQERRVPSQPWSPLFPRRQFPRDFPMELIGYRQGAEFEIAPGKISDRRLENGLRRADKSTVKRYLNLLGLMAGGHTSNEELAAFLSTSIIEITQAITTIESWGLIDGRRHLTDEGRAELARVRMKPRRVTFALQGSMDPYYPQQLRGVGGI
ncbi:phosphoribosyltransferase-like protein [Pseudofrankia inefficax]|nr:hypothetical protein [Pseudofrankia inefficax]